MADWSNEHVQVLRKRVEHEFQRITPEMLHDYDELCTVVRDTLTQMGVDLTNPEVVYALWLWTGVQNTQATRLNVCQDEHVQSHIDLGTILTACLLRESTKMLPGVPQP